MPKQTTTEDLQTSKVPALNRAAIEYAEIRDRRMEMTNEEVEAKAKVLNLMKKHDLSTYAYGRINVRLVVGEDTVKVKIKPDAEE